MAGHDIEFKFPLRPCLAPKRGKREKALFHRWADSAIVSNPILKGQVAGQFHQVYAIVEFEDGTVSLVPCENVVFMDNQIDDYFFSKADSKKLERLEVEK